MCYNLQALGESLGTGDDVKDMDVIEKVMRVSHALKKKKKLIPRCYVVGVVIRMKPS